jgi:hypothetical protein
MPCALAAAAAVSAAVPAAADAHRCPAAPAGPVTANATWTWTTDAGDRYARVTARVAAPTGRVRLSGTGSGSSAVLTAPIRGGDLGSLGSFTSTSRPSGTVARRPPAGRLTTLRMSVLRRGGRLVFSWLPAAAPAVLTEYALPEHYAELQASASLPLAAVCRGAFELHLHRRVALYAPGLRSVLKVVLVADLRLRRR